MSYLRGILSAAARGGLPQKRERSILKELRRHLERTPEEQLNKCFLGVEKSRQTKIPVIKLKTLEITNGDETLVCRIEKNENGETVLVPEENERVDENENLSKLGVGQQVGGIPFVDPGPLARISSYAVWIVLTSGRGGLSWNRMGSIIKEIRHYLETLSDPEVEECFLELERTRSANYPREMQKGH